MGLEIRLMVSFFGVVSWISGILSMGIGVWLWWLCNHAGDWQNGSGLLLTLITVLDLFWMPLGAHFNKEL